MKRFAREENLEHIEVSAKTGQNVQEVNIFIEILFHVRTQLVIVAGVWIYLF